MPELSFTSVAVVAAVAVAAPLDSPDALARVPLFLAALLLVRAAPALLYRPLVARTERLAAAGLLQATSLGLLVVGGQIGVEMGLVRPTNYVALVAAGLLSVIALPPAALTLLKRSAVSGDGQA